MAEKIIRFEDMKNIDKTLYYQCREYIKLCLLIEELQYFKNKDGEYVYDELIKQTLMKANLLLKEFDVSLQRIKNKLDGDLEMTEKQFEIICEDSSLVDVPLYVISDDKLKFDIYGSKKDAERLCTLLNENEQLKKEIEELEERNQRQYNRLKELTELMYEKQWGKLENMVEEWEKQEELLQKEWGTYCGDKE